MHQKLVQFLRREPLRFVFIVFAMIVVKEIVYINTFRDRTSPIADSFSEANTIRGGTFFIEQGLTKYYGLPDIGYSDLLPDTGVRGYPGFDYVPGAYTHYPPGPEYMAWLGFNIFGARNYNLLRYLPITLSILVGLFFIKTMFLSVGGGFRGLLFGLLLILPPMYGNFMHGLHHQQYAFLMLQLQMSLCVRYFTQKSWKNYYTVLAFFILGFCQGWMTFDYAFLATLFPIPFFFYHRAQTSFKSFLCIGLASGLSFTLAHALHFWQVVSYYGDFQLALDDLLGSAKHRLNNAASKTDTPVLKYDSRQIGPITVAKDYLYRVAGRGKYLAVNLINFVWVIVALKFIKEIRFKKGWKFEFSVSGQDLLALLAAVIVSSGWSLVMKQHAHIHGFIARHYYLAYFFCCLILIERTKRIEE